jgi:hypothetical protein
MTAIQDASSIGGLAPFTAPFTGLFTIAFYNFDRSGRLLNDTRQTRLRDSDHKHPDRIATFLQQYAPPLKSLAP